MKFYEKLSDEIEYGGKVYRIKPTYDRILKIFYVFNKEEGLLPGNYLGLCLDLLIEGKHPESPGLLTAILEKITEPTENGQHDPVLFDFEQDSDLIYAGFMQAYGIDLTAEVGRLRWEKFMALFKGLPENTEFRRIVKLRATPIPKANKQNMEYIAHLTKAKQAVALKNKTQKNFYQGLKNIVEQIKADATKGR